MKLDLAEIFTMAGGKVPVSSSATSCASEGMLRVSARAGPSHSLACQPP